MAIASVELSDVRAVRNTAAPIYGACVRQESLTISGTTATLATAVTAAEVAAAEGLLVARIMTDTACFVAHGVTPDPTATAATSATSARRYVPAGVEFVQKLNAGDKVAVHS